MSEHINLSYQGALEAAGATVHAFEEFGSYQGDWWALVTYKGETGWVHGYFGSCSGCDAIQREFDSGFGDAEVWEWGTGESRKKSDAEIADEKERFAEFGRSYLDDMLYSQEDALKKASEDLEWDMEAREVVEFIKRHEVQP